MSLNGTGAYETADDLPPLVERAVALARDLGFGLSCRPEQGRLLQVLAAGRAGGVVGETGTGCGVGLAWMASGADPATHFVSVEVDPGRAVASAALFADHPNVTVLAGDWTALLDHGPFDLLVLDGGGAGKGPEAAVDVTAAVAMGGTVVVDDFTPMTGWPPTFDGAEDTARLHWLRHPALRATEIRLAPDLASVVGTRIR